jgi:hypothetical protein
VEVAGGVRRGGGEDVGGGKSTARQVCRLAVTV